MELTRKVCTMKHHQANAKYTDRMRSYYNELSYRMKSGEDFSELENFIVELRELTAEATPEPELRRVANGGWA